MLTRGKSRGKSAPPIYPAEPIPDEELRGVDGRSLSRGDVVRNPEHFNAAMRVTVPSRAGRIVDIYRRNGQELVEVALDGTDGAAGRALWPAARMRRSQARIRTEVEAMPREKR